MKTPTTFNEAVMAVKELLNKSPDAKTWLAMEETEALVNAHHAIGRSIRNEWGLWQDSPLKNDMVKLGLEHPDDMSSVILTTAHRMMNGKCSRLVEQINGYREYWGKEPLSNESTGIKSRYDLIKEGS